jgi:hypothetical protein
VSAVLDRRPPKRLDLLVAQCSTQEDAGARKPVLERLREKIGAELTRLLLCGLAGRNQRTRPARRPG